MPAAARRSVAGPRPTLVDLRRDGSPVHVCAAIPAAGDVLARRITPCYGVATTRRGAVARARWELAERRAGVWRGDEPVIRAAWSEVAAHAVPPNALLLLSARQWRGRGPTSLLGLDRSRRLPWVEARRLAGPGTRLVPAQLVYYGAPGAPGRADSNGCAAGRTLADATLRALLELVERDAVALWWYHRVRRPAVPIPTGNPVVARMLAWLDARGRDVWVLDLTTDLGIPVVVAVSILRGRARPRPLLGFGARMDRDDAVVRALIELAQEEAIVRATDDGRWAQLRADRSWLRHATLDAHPHLVPVPGRQALAAPPAPSARDRGGREAAAVARLVRRLTRAGLDPLVVDQTRPGGPCRVVRALVPGLRPWWARFAPGRLFVAPVAARWCARVGDESSLNPFAIWF